MFGTTVAFCFHIRADRVVIVIISIIIIIGACMKRGSGAVVRKRGNAAVGKRGSAKKLKAHRHSAMLIEGSQGTQRVIPACGVAFVVRPCSNLILTHVRAVCGSGYSD